MTTKGNVQSATRLAVVRVIQTITIVFSFEEMALLAKAVRILRLSGQYRMPGENVFKTLNPELLAQLWGEIAEILSFKGEVPFTDLEITPWRKVMIDFRYLINHALQEEEGSKFLQYVFNYPYSEQEEGKKELKDMLYQIIELQLRFDELTQPRVEGYIDSKAQLRAALEIVESNIEPTDYGPLHEPEVML